MAKVSSIEKNNRRKILVDKLSKKRLRLKIAIHDKSLPLSERVSLVLKLANLSRDSSKVRLRNRCVITGRSRGVIRKFGLSRNIMRDWAGKGYLSGVIKASW